MKTRNLIFSPIIFAVLVILYFAKFGYLAGTILFTVGGLELFFIVSALVNRRKIDVNIYSNLDKVIVFIYNGSFLPQMNLLIELLYENITTQEKEVKKIKVSILPREKRNFEFEIHDSEQGGIEISVINIEYRSLTGMFCFRQSISQEKCLMNKGIKLDESYIKDFSSDLYYMESYKFSKIHKGNDASDIFGISVYDASKSIKNIHWKLSSKNNQILVRELGFPVESNITVVLDKHIDEVLKNELSISEEDRVLKRKSLNLESTRIALSISYALIHKNIKHKFIWFDFDISALESYSINTVQDYNKMVSKIVFARWSKDVPKLEKQLAINNITERGSWLFVVTQNEGDLNLDNIKGYGEVNIYTPKK